MAIKAVVFDIGGVLEYTPELGTMRKWEGKLGLESGEINRRLHEVWRGGSIGTISTEAEVHRRISEIMGLDAAVVNEFMEDIWVEYLNQQSRRPTRSASTAFCSGTMPRRLPTSRRC